MAPSVVTSPQQLRLCSPSLDGSVVTWGHADRVFEPISYLFVDGSIDVVKVVASGSAFAALRVDGSVISWGSSGGNSSSVASAIDGVPDDQDVVDIVATNDAFAALRVDGSVVTWGNPSRGGDSSGVDFEGTSDDLHVSRLFSNFCFLCSS